MLLWAREKSECFGNDSTSGQNRRQQERGKLNLRWIDSMKEAIGVNLQELSRAAKDRTLWALFSHRVTRTDSVAFNTHKAFRKDQIHRKAFLLHWCRINTMKSIIDRNTLIFFNVNKKVGDMVPNVVIDDVHQTYLTKLCIQLCTKTWQMKTWNFKNIKLRLLFGVFTKACWNFNCFAAVHFIKNIITL